jgi:hypothetical protein
MQKPSARLMRYVENFNYNSFGRGVLGAERDNE